MFEKIEQQHFRKNEILQIENTPCKVYRHNHIQNTAKFIDSKIENQNDNYKDYCLEKKFLRSLELIFII